MRLVLIAFAVAACAPVPTHKPSPRVVPVRPSLVIGESPGAFISYWGSPCETQSATTADGTEDVMTWCDFCGNKDLARAFGGNREQVCRGKRVVTFVDKKATRIER